MLKNEIYSFQMIGWYTGTELQRKSINIKIESPISDYISIKRVGFVPSLVPCFDYFSDDDYLRKTPGLFPDTMFDIDDGNIFMMVDKKSSVWFSIEPNGMISGTFPINITVSDDKSTLCKLRFDIDIINAELPELPIYNTAWFHVDCLLNEYGIDVLNTEYLKSKHFLDILEKYIKVFAKFGHNSILTPIFTPPIDTAEGNERPTVQLVDITINNNSYSFGFDNLEKWIDICKKHGIKYFEISHLFTQGGAKFAPKIMATVDDVYKRIFGWETKASDKNYADFLGCFLPELIAFLKDKGIDKSCFFHISDEPTLEQIDDYQKAKAVVYPYIKDYPIIDALSDYEFYKTGIVETPVVSLDHTDEFLNNNAKNIWVYYCCAQCSDVANRFMSMPSYRNRILGYQLYKNSSAGFLHWGFNYWYSRLSLRKIDPYAVTDSDGGFPSGDAYLVYPFDENGNVVLSLRIYVFNEAMQDLRALKLLEELKGKDYVFELLKDIDGYKAYPKSEKYIVDIRERINREIEKCSVGG